jgi:hypothetical protein
LKRLALPLVIAALGVAAIAASGASASVPPPTGVNRTCSTYSKNVTTPKVGKNNVRGTVTGTNVDPSQIQFASCGTAKKVMNRMLSLRIEEPKVTEGFRCTPTVQRTEPDWVKYSCVFKGADTATFIKLVFTAKYDQD